MDIREATKQEKKEALEIARELKEWFTKEAIKNMKNDFDFNRLVVAVKKDDVLGFMCYTTYSGKILLIWLGIKKQAQRKGIGKMLLEYLEKQARKHNIHTIELETLPDEDTDPYYKITRNFYYKNGFKRTLYKKASVAGYDDQIVLEKEIR